MRERTQVNKIRGKKVILQQIPLESWWSLGNILKTYSNELENLQEMDKFLDTYDVPKLN
jgi:hypothetical protein